MLPDRRTLLGGVLLALWAGLTLASGLDRMAVGRDWPAEWLPRVLQVEALPRQGERALAERRGPEAVALATAAMRRDPLAPTSSALLGAARLSVGDASGAHKAFMFAGQRGWRVPLTQAYLYQNALDNDEPGRAALRLDALLRVNPDLAHDGALSAPLEASPEGRAAMADRLALRPSWAASYLRDAGDVPPDRLLLRTAVLATFAARHGPIGCSSIAPIAASLDSQHQPGYATQMRRLHCRAGVRGWFD